MQFKTYIHFYFRYHYGILCTYCIWFLTKIIHVFLGTCTTSYPYSVVYFVYFEIILIYFMLQWWRLWPKTNWGGSSLHISQFRVHKAELKARTWGAGNRAQGRKWILFNSWSSSLFSLLSYNTQYHLPSGGTSHSRLSSSTTIINQENAPKSRLQANLTEEFSQLKLPLPRWL